MTHSFHVNPSSGAKDNKSHVAADAPQQRHRQISSAGLSCQGEVSDESDHRTALAYISGEEDTRRR